MTLVVQVDMGMYITDTISADFWRLQHISFYLIID